MEKSEVKVLEKDRIQIKKSLKDTLFFFIAIMQYQVFRILNNFIRKTDGINDITYLRVTATVLYHLSEIVMIICLCHSIRTVVATLKQQNETILRTCS